jgi:hypothetical protein
VYALAELSSRFKGEVVDTALSAMTLEAVVVAPSRNPTNKLAITRSSRSNLFKKEHEHRHEIAVLMAKKMKLPRVQRL